MIEPFHKCPRFDHCSSNACPLGVGQASHLALRGDDPCGARRAGRVAIAVRYALPGGGLTHAEVMRDRRSAASKARWDALPQSEKDARTQRLTQARVVLSGVLAGDDRPEGHCLPPATLTLSHVEKSPCL